MATLNDIGIPMVMYNTKQEEASKLITYQEFIDQPPTKDYVERVMNNANLVGSLMDNCTFAAYYPPTTITIELGNKGGIKLYQDGKCEFYGDYNPDAATKVFWQAVQERNPARDAYDRAMKGVI